MIYVKPKANFCHKISLFAGLVAFGVVVCAMTGKKAPATESASVFETQTAHIVRFYYVDIKVNKIGVVGGVTLAAAYTMCIVAYRTRGIFSTYMAVVLAKGIVIKDGITIMA